MGFGAGAEGLAVAVAGLRVSEGFSVLVYTQTERFRADLQNSVPEALNPTTTMGY